jgi:hypothetical protein
MASWVGLPSMLSPISSTFRNGHVLARAGMFMRNPRAGAFTRSTPRSTSLSPARHCSSCKRHHELVSLLRRLRGLKTLLPPRLPFAPHLTAGRYHPITTTVYNNPTKSLFSQHSRSFWAPLNQFGPRYISQRFPTNSNAIVIMLRRPATTIQLTVADVEQYEANRQRKLWEQQQQQQTQQQASSQSTIASENTNDQTESVPMKSRKERIMGGNGRAN